MSLRGGFGIADPAPGRSLVGTPFGHDRRRRSLRRAGFFGRRIAGAGRGRHRLDLGNRQRAALLLVLGQLSGRHRPCAGRRARPLSIRLPEAGPQGQRQRGRASRRPRRAASVPQLRLRVEGRQGRLPLDFDHRLSAVRRRRKLRRLSRHRAQRHIGGGVARRARSDAPPARSSRGAREGAFRHAGRRVACRAHDGGAQRHGRRLFLLRSGRPAGPLQ